MKALENIWQKNPTAFMSRFNPFSRFRISLTSKFIVAMIFLVLMGAAAFGYFFVAREVALLRTEMETYGRSMANAFSPLFTYGIGLSDRSFLQRQVEIVVEDENIVQCSVFDRSGEKLASAVKKGLPPGSRSCPSLHSDHPIPGGSGHRNRPNGIFPS